MSVVDRIRRIARAHARDLREKAEIPELALERDLADLQQAVEDGEHFLAEFAAAQDDHAKQRRRLELERENRRRAAVDALERGNEDEARLAAADKLRTETRLAHIEELTRRGAQTQTELEANLAVLRRRLVELRQKLRELRTRATAARAEKRIGRHADRAQDPERERRTSRIAERVAHEEDSEDARRRVALECRPAQSRLDDIEFETRVEAELNELRMQGHPPPRSGE